MRTEEILARARAGDEDAFRELTDPYRREIKLHCYRILGSLQDAEDLVQETLLAAWRSLEGFEGRASVCAWLYRIATDRASPHACGPRGRAPRKSQGPARSRRTGPCVGNGGSGGWICRLTNTGGVAGLIRDGASVHWLSLSVLHDGTERRGTPTIEAGPMRSRA